MLRATRVYALLFGAAVMAAPQITGGGGKTLASDYVGPDGGRWRDPASWRPAGVPGAGGTANVNLAPDGAFSVNMDFTYTSATALSTVGIDSSTSGMLTLNIFANLFAANEYIASSGIATIEHSNFTNSVSAGLLLGNGTASTGTYNLSNTGNLYVNVYETIGWVGSGQFNQSGGTNTVGTSGSGEFRLGENFGSSGTYALGSGSLTVNGRAWIGGGGTGSFTQSGGTHSVSGNEYIGDGGAGSVIQSGGSHTIGAASANSELHLGESFGSNGSYNLSGTGSLNVNGIEKIGVSGTGTFTQTGGTHSVSYNAGIPEVLFIGYQGGSSGSYDLSGTGNLTVMGFETVGYLGAGTFTQSGGTHNVGSAAQIYPFFIGRGTGGSGSYTLSGGSLTVSQDEHLGYQGSASFTQSGGTHVIGTSPTNHPFFYLGERAGSSGSYTLSGGTLTVNAMENIGGAGTATFIQSGGTHTIGSPSSTFTNLNIGAMGSGPGGSSGGLGSYSLSGAGSLIVNGMEFISAVGPGTFTQTGGSHSVSGDEYVGYYYNGTYAHSGGTHTVGTPSANANLTVAYFEASTGSYTLSGTASLTVNGDERIGYNFAGGSSSAANGVFTQSGGTQTITGTAFIGGTSTAGAGIGTLNISGGTANIGTLKVWNSGAAAPSGTRVNLSGGTLSVGSLDITANPARFNWTGGTLDFKNGMVVDVGGPLGAAVNLGSGMTLATSGGTLSNNGMITLSGGSVGGSSLLSNAGVISGNGSVGGSGGFSNFGDVTPGGIITLVGSGASSNFGEMDVAAGNTLRLMGAPLQNMGTIRLSGGMVGGTSQLSNQSGGTITGRGTITAPLGTSSGNIAVSDGTLNISNAFTNAGVIQLAGVAGTLAGGAITNTGTVQGFGNVNNVISNTGGTVEAVGGTLVMNAVTSSSNGLLAASVGNKLLFTAGLSINGGTMSLAGGTFDNGGHVISNTGQISGYGIFRSGGLTNNGEITFAGGTSTVNGNVVNAVGKKAQVRYAPAVFTGNFTNNGIFKSTGASVTFTGIYSENGQFISDPAENYFNDVVIGSGGAWSGGVGDRFIVGGDLMNGSSAKEAWETSLAELSFAGGGSHAYAAAGSDVGISFAGYEDNFAWGRLVLGAGDSLALSGDAVYVGVLELKGGLAQIGAVDGSGNIYYDLREPANAYLGGKSYELAGGGMIAAVPEAGSVLMCLLAVGGAAMRRRKGNSR